MAGTKALSLAPNHPELIRPGLVQIFTNRALKALPMRAGVGA
jgi:hypothetical protein